jgi:hypothetical protein
MLNAGDNVFTQFVARTSPGADQSGTAASSSQPMACVHVVTRQNIKNRSAIVAFLESTGIDTSRIQIHCLGGLGAGKAAKANVITELLSSGERGMFVDDTIAEHMEERLVNHPRLLRVLFSCSDYTVKSTPL